MQSFETYEKLATFTFSRFTVKETEPHVGTNIEINAKSYGKIKENSVPIFI